MKNVVLICFSCFLLQYSLAQIRFNNQDSALMYNGLYNKLTFSGLDVGFMERLTVVMGSEYFYLIGENNEYGLSLRGFDRDTTLLINVYRNDKTLLCSQSVNIQGQLSRFCVVGSELGAVALNDRFPLTLPERYLHQLRALELRSLVKDRPGLLDGFKFIYFRKHENEHIEGECRGAAFCPILLDCIKSARAGDRIYLYDVIGKPTPARGCFAPRPQFEIFVRP